MISQAKSDEKQMSLSQLAGELTIISVFLNRNSYGIRE